MESTSPSLQFYADEFVESAGAIVFNFSTRQICLIYNAAKNEYLLPKGRRNCSESRANAALREVLEETGHTCTLLPIIMGTRAPPADEQDFTPDVPQIRENLCEPLALTIREEGERRRKLIWWYVAQVDVSVERVNQSHFDKDLVSVWVSFEEVVDRLSFQGDRELVERSIAIIHSSMQL